MSFKTLVIVSIMIGVSWTLEGDNVCPETESYLVNVTRSITKTIQIRHYKWCMNIPPRCSFYTEEQRHVPEIVEEEQFRIISKCCPGFYEDEKNNTCISQCDKCKNGQCEFNICICDPGFKGENCDTVCPNTHWGRNCKSVCLCQHGDCNPASGNCTCYFGWTGKDCNQEMTTTRTTTVPTETTRLATSVVLNQSTPTKYPTLQKYYTFFFTTHKPNSSNSPETKSTIVKVPATSNGRISGITWISIANTTTTDVTLSTITPPENLKTQEVTVTTNDKATTLYNEKVNNVTEVEFKNDLVLHYDQSHHLLFSIGAVIGITATIVFMVAALFVTRIYVRQKHSSVVSVVAKSGKNNEDNGVCIFTSSMFHSPLPDPPTFENPIFVTPLENEVNANDFGSTLHTQIIYSMQTPTHSTFKTDSTNISTFYDHPPSTGSYRAASIPELPPSEQCPGMSVSNEQKEHLYDEIPCWKQPYLANASETSTDVLISYYANCKHIE